VSEKTTCGVEDMKVAVKTVKAGVLGGWIMEL
jgi:hypothetical protein